MHISQEQLDALTRQVWAAMVGSDLVDAIMAASPGGVSSQIEICGAEGATLRIDCSLPLARAVAARLFDLPPEEIEHELVLDAMGEIANVIGGHIKGAWPGAVRLSLPVTRETDAGEPAPSWPVSQGFAAGDGELSVHMKSSDA